MTLPTTTQNNGADDDSDMFGPPRSSPIGYHHHRSRVPMISPKLRQREERKRILQLCAHKLERIKDSETNLRRSVCINNTYCRLTDELRREKQSRYLANIPKSETKPETARDNIFNPYNSCGIDSSNHQPSNKSTYNNNNNNDVNANARSIGSIENQPMNGDNLNKFHANSSQQQTNNNNSNNNHLQHHHHQQQQQQPHHNNDATAHNSALSSNSLSPTNYHNNCTATNNNSATTTRKRQLSSNTLDTDLEILDRELNAINAPMPLIDPEITQGAEQLEKAVSSRKRLLIEDETDRTLREALSLSYYIPPQRLISAIEDCPLDVVNVSSHAAHMSMGMMSMSGMSTPKRAKMSPGTNELELDFDMNQNQKEFEVIMDALRLSTPSPTPSMGSDSCGQAAMMSESASVFHNLVVTSLET